MLRIASQVRWISALLLLLLTGPLASRAAAQFIAGGPTVSARVVGEREATLAVRLPDGKIVDAGLTSRVLARLPRVGDQVRVSLDASVSPARYYVQDFDRRPALVVLGALFLLVSLAVARGKGLRAVLGMVISLGVILLAMIPAILAGWNPVLVALLGSAGILLFSVYFVHGVNWSTTAALVGTLATAGLTIGLAGLVARLAYLNGVAGDEALILNRLGLDIDLRALLLGGVIIGALGALVDSTVPQAAVVREMAHLQPGQDWRALYVASMRVGLDHIGSLINTLVLAYAGSSMPLFVLLHLNRVDLGTVLNTELIATAVVQTLVGSIGLVLAVPVTSLLAALAFQKGRLPAPSHAELHAHHHHH